MNKRLNVISSVNGESGNRPFIGSKTSFKHETQAKFNRLWLTDPQQFNPQRNIMEKERLNRTLSLIQETIPISGKLAADLGCGSGVFTRILRDHGATVHAIDVSAIALQALKEHDCSNIEPIQDCLPSTSLKDDFYDLVVSTELIALLPVQEHRIYISELSRLVKPGGYVVCSTGLDINTIGALDTFAALAETEFHQIHWIFSHQALYIRIKDFFESPQRFAKASRDPEYRKSELGKRVSFHRWWFGLNTSPILGSFWSFLQYLTLPIVHLLKNQLIVLNTLEKICRFIQSDSGISHAIFIAKRRPLFQATQDELAAVERKHKKQVWE